MAEGPSDWGDQIAVEHVGGVLYRMYVQRPRQIAELLAFADRWGDRPYVVQGDRIFRFGDLRRAAANKARDLSRMGVRPGQHVFLLGWNSADWVVNFWAVMEVGAVAVMVNSWWSEAEMADAVARLRPALVLADARGARIVPPGCACGPWETSPEATEAPPLADGKPKAGENDPAVIIFTSGTSGKPKAVVLSHRALLANLQMLLQMSRRLPHQVGEDSADVALHTGPLFHIGGVQALMRGVTVGNTLVMPAGRFDPADIISLIQRWKVTRWSAVPTMITRLLDHPDLPGADLSSLRAVTLGGAPLHAELQARIRAELPGAQARIATGYGLSENGGQATGASEGDIVRRPGTSGRALPLAEIKTVPRDGLPDGEIMIRSPTQMSAYFGEKDSPIDADGWLATGDLGKLDDDGFIWITGRCKDLIIRGGENIAPAAVERALVNLPGVLDAVVFGLPHAELGEEVAAVVVVADGASPADIQAQLRANVASFSVPSWWRFQSDPLPLNPTGKVDKPTVVAEVRAALSVGAPA